MAEHIHRLAALGSIAHGAQDFRVPCLGGGVAADIHHARWLSHGDGAQQAVLGDLEQREEQAEREVLRGEYRAAVRENLRAALDNTYIMDEKGNKRPLKKKSGK